MLAQVQQLLVLVLADAFDQGVGQSLSAVAVASAPLMNKGCGPGW
ncbi:MAG: hypothetical protein R2712_11700 [Vicinamibacterales bacterium]